MFYLNAFKQLFLFVEQLDQLELYLPYSRLLTGIPILAVFQNLWWNSNKTSLLFRNTSDVDNELLELKATKEKQSHGLTMLEALKNLSRSEVRTPFLLVIANFVFTMFSGPIITIFYSVDIFEDAGINVNKYLAAIITAVIRVIGRKESLLVFGECLFSTKDVYSRRGDTD